MSVTLTSNNGSKPQASFWGWMDRNTYKLMTFSLIHQRCPVRFVMHIK
jgi:hypothetical protein